MTVKVTWLGHACVLLEHEETTMIIDPWIDNPKSPGIKPDKIDVMLITHGHNDHFGNAVELAQEHKPAMIPVMHEMSVYLQSKGVENVVGMNYGGIVKHGEIKIAMVPSSHSSGLSDDEGMQYMGTPAGYVIAFPDGNIFYHCGDTGVTAEMGITKDLYAPTIGLLAIGGHYTMGPKQAAYAAKMMNLRAVIPIHWGTFPLLAGNPDKLKTHLDETSIEVKALEPGGSVEFPTIEDSTAQSYYS
ncbi:MAG: metal-dependent hydrolase [Candidatus Kariarchaeaceae archaeon]|jgi:L-ascorbate metabolism protein UlaG (beta-lactamase superfamily)